MKVRNVLLLGLVLTVVIAVITNPVYAQGPNSTKAVEKADDSGKNGGSTSGGNGGSSSTAPGQANSNGQKGVIDSPTVTPTPLSGPAAGSAAVSTVTSPGQVRKNLVTRSNGTPKLDKLPTPSSQILPTPRAALQDKTPVSEVRLKGEKALGEAKMRVTVNQIDLYLKWVNNSRLSESDKALLRAEAADNLDWYQQQASDLKTATSLADIQALMAEVDQHNALIKVSLKKDAGLLASDDVDQKIGTASNVSELVGARIAALDSSNADKARLGELLADYDEHVTAAASYSDAAKADFNSITAENQDHSFTQGYAELQRADAELTKAYADLKNIYRLLLK